MQRLMPCVQQFGATGKLISDTQCIEREKKNNSTRSDGCNYFA